MNLREYLDEKRITYREFAEKLGIHLQSLKNIAYSSRKPGLSLALSIEKLTEGKVKPQSFVIDSAKDTKVKPKRKSVRKHLE